MLHRSYSNTGKEFYVGKGSSSLIPHMQKNCWKPGVEMILIAQHKKN